MLAFLGEVNVITSNGHSLWLPSALSSCIHVPHSELQPSPAGALPPLHPPLRQVLLAVPCCPSCCAALAGSMAVPFNPGLVNDAAKTVCPPLLNDMISLLSFIVRKTKTGKGKDFPAALALESSKCGAVLWAALCFRKPLKRSSRQWLATLLDLVLNMLLYRVTEIHRLQLRMQQEHAVLVTIMFITDSYLYNPLLWIIAPRVKPSFWCFAAQLLLSLSPWPFPNWEGEQINLAVHPRSPPLSDLQVKETHSGRSPSHSNV